MLIELFDAREIRVNTVHKDLEFRSGQERINLNAGDNLIISGLENNIEGEAWGLTSTCSQAMTKPVDMYFPGVVSG